MLLKILRIHGHSMQPTIADGQKVLISNIPYLLLSPKINDIVAFKLGDKIFVKRIYSISKDKYLLEGDNKNDSLDSREIGLVGKANILGKVIFV